jgi:hypothetical protein
MVLINPTSRPIHYEVQLFRPDGSSAKDVLESLEYFEGTLHDDGRLHWVVAPNSVWYWFLDPFDFGDDHFMGWAILRADGELQTYLRIYLLAIEDLRIQYAPISSVTANYQGVQSASYRVEASKERSSSDYRGPDGKREPIWEIAKSGVSVVNPGEMPLTLDLMLDSQCLDEELTRSLVLEPKTQEAFLVDSLFDSFSPDTCDSSGRLKIVSNEGDFSVMAVDVTTFKKLNGGDCPSSLCERPFHYLPSFGRGVVFGNRFDFPEEIVLRETIGQFEAVLTRFGLILLREGGEVDGIHPFAYGDGNPERQGFLELPEHGIALVWGRENTPFIFTSSGKVVVAKRAGFGRPSSITIEYMEEENLIKFSGKGCYDPIIVVDLLTEEIVSQSQVYCGF